MVSRINRLGCVVVWLFGACQGAQSDVRVISHGLMVKREQQMLLFSVTAKGVICAAITCWLDTGTIGTRSCLNAVLCIICSCNATASGGWQVFCRVIDYNSYEEAETYC